MKKQGRTSVRGLAKGAKAELVTNPWVGSHGVGMTGVVAATTAYGTGGYPSLLATGYVGAAAIVGARAVEERKNLGGARAAQNLRTGGRPARTGRLKKFGR